MLNGQRIFTFVRNDVSLIGTGKASPFSKDILQGMTSRAVCLFNSLRSNTLMFAEQTLHSRRLLHFFMYEVHLIKKDPIRRSFSI